MFNGFNLSNLHILAIIFGTFVTAIVALLAHMLNRSRLKIESERFEHEQQLIKSKSQHEAKALLRTEQLEMAIDLFGIIGRMVSTETNKKFDRDWFDLASIQFGRAFLLDSPDFHKKLEVFCDFLWEYEDMETRDSMSDAEERKFQKAAQSLSIELKKCLAEQFNLPQPKLFELDIKAAKKRKTK